MRRLTKSESRLWQEGSDGGAIARMTVSNDGAPAPVSYREGTGIPGMRHVAQNLGGSLEVHAAPPFTLAVSIPLNSNATVKGEAHDSYPYRRRPPSCARASRALLGPARHDRCCRHRRCLRCLGRRAQGASGHDFDGRAPSTISTASWRARIKEQLPECRVIIMTGMPEITFVDQAREAGVDSFVYKNVGIDELFAVMRSTLAGYCTFSKPPESIFSGTAAARRR
ncbi:MAG: hypothetical protein ACLRM9_00340 [Collinsella aerofaciens]